MQRLVKYIKAKNLDRIQMSYKRAWGNENGTNGLLIGTNDHCFILSNATMNSYMNPQSMAEATFKFINKKGEIELELVAYKNCLKDIHEIMSSMFKSLTNASIFLNKNGSWTENPSLTKGYKKISVGSPSSTGEEENKTLTSTTAYSYTPKKKKMYFLCSEGFEAA